LCAIGFLCPAYHISSMDELRPGYQNVLSQLVAAVAGRNFFYYVSLASIFIILTYSAQTSFADFPRVCHFLAEDGFLPPIFAKRGRRLVFSQGIVVLAVLSALLLVVFGGITQRLIPLFAVGAFGAFLASQASMVRHWWRKRGPRFRTKLFFNTTGALTTAVALVVIILAKFKEGGWMTLIIVPSVVLLLRKIDQHYKYVDRLVGQAVKVRTSELQLPIVIIPITGWDRRAEQALRFGLLLSNEITAVHISTEHENNRPLRKNWHEKVETPVAAAKLAVPRLEILNSPYRRVARPIVDFVNRIAQQNPERLIAVIIPELVEPHWYGYLLHSFYATRLRTRLLLKGDERIVVISTGWRLPKN
jgi:Amino acid permease